MDQDRNEIIGMSGISREIASKTGKTTTWPASLLKGDFAEIFEILTEDCLPSEIPSCSKCGSISELWGLYATRLVHLRSLEPAPRAANDRAKIRDQNLEALGQIDEPFTTRIRYKCRRTVILSGDKGAPPSFGCLAQPSVEELLPSEPDFRRFSPRLIPQFRGVLISCSRDQVRA